MLSYGKLSNRDINRAGTQETNAGMTSGLVSTPAGGDGLLLPWLLRILNITPSVNVVFRVIKNRLK